MSLRDNCIRISKKPVVHIAVVYYSNTLVFAALLDPWSFCHFKFRSNYGYLMKEYKKLRQISKTIDHFKVKKSYGDQSSDSGPLLQCKKMRRSLVSQYRLAWNFIIDFYDSSEAYLLLPCLTYLKWGEKEQILLRLWSQVSWWSWNSAQFLTQLE